MRRVTAMRGAALLAACLATAAQAQAWRLEGARVVDGAGVNDGKSGVTWDGNPGAMMYTYSRPGMAMKCAFTWTAAPAQLTPGQALDLKGRVEWAQLPPGGYHGCGLSLCIDNAVRDAASGCNVDLYAGAGARPSVEFPVKAKVSEVATTGAKVPGAGFGDAQKKLYLRVSAGPGVGELMRAVVYTYAWGGSGGAAPVPAAGGTPRILFDNWNKAGVGNGPGKATSFTLSAPATITRVFNYHWNGGRGQSPIGTIALKGADGRTYGPWQATSMGGAAPAANWFVTPNVQLPAGTYTVVDSHPASWSQNPGSGGAGFSQVMGY